MSGSDCLKRNEPTESTLCSASHTPPSPLAAAAGVVFFGLAARRRHGGESLGRGCGGMDGDAPESETTTDVGRLVHSTAKVVGATCRWWAVLTKAHAGASKRVWRQEHPGGRTEPSLLSSSPEAGAAASAESVPSVSSYSGPVQYSGSVAAGSWKHPEPRAPIRSTRSWNDGLWLPFCPRGGGPRAASLTRTPLLWSQRKLRYP